MAALAGLLIVLAAVARFFFLEADFPIELTISGAPLTDEGWHSNAAVRSWLFGYWYLPGDVNEAIMQPMFHLLQWITFSGLGVSLVSARLTATLLFLGLAALMASSIRLQAGLTGALLVLALLTTDFHLFAYSRIALVELPMLFFVVASLWLLMKLGSRRPVLGGTLAGLAYSWALLTKPSAIFAAAALILVAALGPERPELRAKRVLGFLSAAVLSTGLHHLVSIRLFPQDQPAHWELITSKIHARSMPVWERAWTAIKIMGGMDLFLCMATLLSVLVIIQHWRKSDPASQRVSVFYLLGAISAFAMVSSTPYQPVRYFLLFIALAIGAVSVATAYAIADGRRLLSLALLTLCALHIGLGTYRTIDYLAHPEWSYRDLCSQLDSALTDSETPVVLMGDMAPQLSMAIGLEAVSGRIGAESAAWRYQRYRPTHLITRGPIDSPLRAAVPAPDDLVLMKTYEVMDNYYLGPVHLYRVVRPPSSTTSWPATE